MSTGSAPARPPLTRERLLTDAVAYADVHGIEGLSMRKLAQHLGFEAMSLYNHVTNKDDLLEGMVEVVAREIVSPPCDVEWKPGIRALATSAHDVQLSHPWVVGLWNRQFPGAARFGQMERLLELIDQGGLTGALGDLAFHAVNLHVNGFTQQQLSYRMDEATEKVMRGRADRVLTPEAYPRMAAHLSYHAGLEGQPASGPDEFAFVLDLILDGLERLRDTA